MKYIADLARQEKFRSCTTECRYVSGHFARVLLNPTSRSTATERYAHVLWQRLLNAGELFCASDAHAKTKAELEDCKRALRERDDEVRFLRAAVLELREEKHRSNVFVAEAASTSTYVSHFCLSFSANLD